MGVKTRVRQDIQAKVDEYIEMDAVMKKMQAELKKLRKEIEPYMEERGLTVIQGSERGSISLMPRVMPVMNARYTSYDKNGVISLLDDEAIEQCIVEVVDKDVLELLVKTNKAPKEVHQYKVVNETRAFTISHK